MFSIISRRSIVVLAGVGAALTLAACDSAGSVTENASQKSFQPTAHHDDGDSACKSGYIDTFGRWTCA
ncbi:MAG: hypothetical protein ABI085_18090 [Gemmatimonadaceae bacterium]